MLVFFLHRPGIEVPGAARRAPEYCSPYIWRHVDPDRPARTVIRTALTDWRGGRAAAGGEARAPRLTASHVRVREELL